MKSHENPSIGDQVVCGLTDGRTERQTYMMRLTVAFRNFANAPNLQFYKECSYVNLSAIGDCVS
jgi:hypothetical protein